MAPAQFLLGTIYALMSLLSFANVARGFTPKGAPVLRTSAARLASPPMPASFLNRRDCSSDISRRRSSSSSSRQGGGYVDVHCHLTHARFKDDLQEVVQRCVTRGLDYVVVNGVRPHDNRKVMELCEEYKHLLPAIGSVC